MFGNPTPFHLVSRAAKLPTLTIICNNGRWQAVESATRVVYPDGAAAHAEEMPLVELQPSPEFTKVAEASDAWAKRVDDPAELPRAIDAALTRRRRRPPSAARRAHGARRPLRRSRPAAHAQHDAILHRERSSPAAYARPPYHTPYDVSPDRERFLVHERIAAATADAARDAREAEIAVVVDWTAGLAPVTSRRVGLELRRGARERGLRSSVCAMRTSVGYGARSQSKRRALYICGTRQTSASDSASPKQ